MPCSPCIAWLQQASFTSHTWSSLQQITHDGPSSCELRSCLSCSAALHCSSFCLGPGPGIAPADPLAGTRLSAVLFQFCVRGASSGLRPCLGSGGALSTEAG